MPKRDSPGCRQSNRYGSVVRPVAPFPFLSLVFDPNYQIGARYLCPSVFVQICVIHFMLVQSNYRSSTTRSLKTIIHFQMFRSVIVYYWYFSYMLPYCRLRGATVTTPG
jgi:hypothetical protein